MQRREFITLLGGAAAAWPLAVRAQQPDRIRRIGVLSSLAADDPGGKIRLAAFDKALRQLGLTPGVRCRLIIAGPRVVPSNLENTQKNWWR
jgi:putative ABC transport system substrate-binding protein